MKITKILFFICLFGTSFASDLKYSKLGTELGVGYRNQINQHGYDVSFNATSMLFMHWLSAKGYYLYYPYHGGFYLGAGGALVYQVGHISAAGRGKSDFLYPSFESLIGYQFKTEQGVHPFIQFGLGVPFSTRAGFPVVPSFTVGVGF